LSLQPDNITLLNYNLLVTYALNDLANYVLFVQCSSPYVC